MQKCNSKYVVLDYLCASYAIKFFLLVERCSISSRCKVNDGNNYFLHTAQRRREKYSLIKENEMRTRTIRHIFFYFLFLRKKVYYSNTLANMSSPYTTLVTAIH